MTAARQQLHLDVELARTNLCIHCHDLDNSPKFDTEENPFETSGGPRSPTDLA